MWVQTAKDHPSSLLSEFGFGGPAGSWTASSLVLDAVALPQRGLMHNLGLLLDSLDSLLLEEQVAVVSKRGFA